MVFKYGVRMGGKIASILIIPSFSHLYYLPSPLYIFLFILLPLTLRALAVGPPHA